MDTIQSVGVVVLTIELVLTNRFSIHNDNIPTSLHPGHNSLCCPPYFIAHFHDAPSSTGISEAEAVRHGPLKGSSVIRPSGRDPALVETSGTGNMETPPILQR